MHNLQWLLGQDIRGSTVGFFGFGGIGQAIAQRLRGFGVAKILYTARTEKAEAKDFKAKKVSFDELCEKSDFIFIAAPLTEETRHIFNECAFDKMQQNSVLVNIGRGRKLSYNLQHIQKTKNSNLFPQPLSIKKLSTMH